MRIAAIDVGTNTAQLLVADVAEDGTLTPLYDGERFVRLGAGVDATGRVGEAAMQRLRAALLDFRAVARAYEVAEIVVGATSASRDARNRAELAAFVRRETGLPYEILSGEEEARWSFLGVLSAFDEAGPPLEGPCAVLDVGGGSTEITLGEAGGRITARYSLDVGSVRLAERFFSTQPPAPAEVARADAFVARALAAAIPLDDTRLLISAAVTPMLVALVDRGAASWDALGTRDVTLAAATVHHWRQRLLAMTHEAVLALNPALMTGRADVFPAAVLLFDAILRHFGLPRCRVSPRSLRHGLALRAYAGGE